MKINDNTQISLIVKDNTFQTYLSLDTLYSDSLVTFKGVAIDYIADERASSTCLGLLIVRNQIDHLNVFLKKELPKILERLSEDQLRTLSIPLNKINMIEIVK